MVARKHLMAVNRTIRAAGLRESGVAAATIELARDLARLMDQASAAEGPAMKLRSMYQSAVKDLQRAAREHARDQAPSAGRTAPETEASSAGATPLTLVGADDAIDGPSPLEALREKKNRAAG